MNESLELENDRLQPLLNYHRLANGELNEPNNFHNFLQGTLGATDFDVEIDWNEDGFNNNDNFDDNMDDKWGNTRNLNLHYSKFNIEVPDQLFEGSRHTSRDLARFILNFKSNNLKIGDTIIAEIVGMFASFLPKGIE